MSRRSAVAVPSPTPYTIETPSGYRSREIALFVAQMDDLSRRRSESLAGIAPAELEWQVRPGSNTIGMLLAHTAIAEAHWMEIGPLARPDSRMPEILGLPDTGADGMPLPPGGTPPPILRGRAPAWYGDLLLRARENTRRVSMPLDDSALERRVTRTRPDGSQRTYSIRWMYYHLVEHEAGHFGQILLLRHLYRTRNGDQP
jgi:uncharacterized damage-inducible protein DinB